MENITLIQGDCFAELQNITEKVDLIIADPPYDLNKKLGCGFVGKCTSANRVQNELINNNISTSYDIEQFARIVKRIQKKNINAYFWCNKKQIPAYFNVYVNKMKCRFNILSWHKQNSLPTYSNKYMSDTEYCLYFFKGKGHCRPNNYDDAKTYNIEKINVKDKEKWQHPTIKPLSIISKLIRNSSQEGDLVLDPFMGSGTTGVAAKEYNRRFIGIEVNEKWYNVANKRILDNDNTIFMT